MKTKKNKIVLKNKPVLKKNKTIRKNNNPLPVPKKNKSVPVPVPVPKKNKTIRKKNNFFKKNKKFIGGYLKKVTQKNINGDMPLQNPSHFHDFSKISSNDPTWNSNLFLRESHNCYTYFLNLKSKEAFELCKKDFNKHNMCKRAQPGYYSGELPLNENDYNCPTIMKRTLKDNPNIYPVKDIHTKCNPKYYKGALVVAPERDYHYYRLDDDGNGVWTHKPGYKPTTNKDSNNNIIFNPEKAARDYGGTLNYKDFCSYLCVPRNSYYKRMAHRDSQNKTIQSLGKSVANIIS